MTIEEKKVYDILLTPIICNKRFTTIEKINEHIQTPQSYYGGADADMSNFAIGFYEIVYNELIEKIGGKLLYGKKELKKNLIGHLINKEFAGDTMNSFNSLASIILGECVNKQTIPKTEWPEYLIEYNEQYHCLANFWLVPMRIGRTGKKMNKYDSLDYFLSCVEGNFNTFCIKKSIAYHKDDKNYENYFRYFNGWNDFREIHCLKQHVIRRLPLDYYKTKNKEGCKELIFEVINTMKQRAEEITVKHGEKLWNYFKNDQNKLIAK